MIRLYIGSFLAIAARYLLVAVAPLTFTQWGARPAFAAILVGIAFLVQMIVSPVMGNLADRRGRRWSLVLGALMMACGGAVVFQFPTIPGFLVGQVLFGIGPAAFFAAAFAVVADVAPVKRIGSAIARFGVLINAAEAVAPPIGLWLGYAGRPWAFGSAAMLTLVAVPFFAGLRTSPPPLQEAKHTKGMPGSWRAPLLIATCMAVSYGAINAFLPQRALQSHANAGWFFLANFGVQILLRLIANRTLDRFARRVLLVFGALTMAISTVLLAYFSGDAALLLLGVLFGIGTFYVTPSVVAWLVELSPTRKGSSMAWYNAAFGAGVAVGAMVLVPVLVSIQAVHMIFWVAGLLNAAGLLAVWVRR